MPGQAAGDSPGLLAPMLATAAAGRVRAWSRGGRNITATYPELGVLAAVARRRTLVLDGEIVTLSGPRPDFSALQRRMCTGRPLGCSPRCRSR